MNFIGIIRLIIRHYILLLVFAIIAAACAYLFSGDQKTSYQSKVVIYTGIASGYSIESIEGSTFNNYKTNNAFDNLINIIKSRETTQKTAIELLATHLSMSKPNPFYLSIVNYKALKAKAPKEVQAHIIADNPDKTCENFTKLYNSNDSNFIYKTINGFDPHYSVKTIEKISVKRVLTSDLIEISYDCNDPGICRHTLQLISKTLIINYRNVFQDQTTAVVKWFEEQVLKSAERLKDAEDKLLDFNSGNNIINYYEQTKFIAEQKELLDREIHQEKKELVGAEASKMKLEKQLGIKDDIFKTTNEILNLKAQYNELLNQIVILEGDKSLPGYNASEVKVLRNNAEILKIKLTAAISQLYNIQNSTEGVSIDRMLTEWLSKVLKVEEYTAKLKALDRRQNEFLQKYATFAPLGATLKRIEREISVCEQDYLERLHGLNLSKLRQQNIELSNNIRVIDEPIMPKTGKTVSKKLLAIIGFIVGFILALTILILLEVFDSTIKSAARAEALTRCKVVGLFPSMRYLSKNPQKELIIKRLIDITIRNTFYRQLIDGKPLRIAFVSTREQEGKDLLATLFVDRLLQRNFNCILLAPESKKIEPNQNHISYNPDDIVNLKSLINDNSKSHIILEVPSLIMNDYPSEIISTFDFVFLVCKSSREWNKADKKTLNRFTETTDKNPEIILNGVDVYQLESIFGEVPQNRSKFRKYIKKMLAFNFLGSKKI